MTQTALCQLSYQASFTRDGAVVTSAQEKERRAVGVKTGESTIFFGAELFFAPRSCGESEIEVSVSAPSRLQLSTSLSQDELVYRASSVEELTQSVWVLGRETELRMLSGAFTAVLIGEAAECSGEISTKVSAMEEQFGQPVARQLLVIGVGVTPKSLGRSALLDLSAANFNEALARSLVSLWLTSPGVSSYYQAWLRAMLGELTPEEFVADLFQDAAAARVFCFDVVARSKGASLAKALQSLMQARQAMTERAISSTLQITACLGDGLAIAAPAAGLSVTKKGAKVVNLAALQGAVGW